MKRPAAATLISLLAIALGCSRLRGEPSTRDAGAPSASAIEAPAIAASQPLDPTADPAPPGPPFIAADPTAASSASRAIDAGVADVDPPPGGRDLTPRRPRSTGEAKRAIVRRVEDDRALAPHKAVIRAHFGGSIPTALELQRADLAGDRRALLVYGDAKDRNPLLLVVDDRDDVLWTKERPLAGSHPGAVEMVILPGPEGEVVITWLDRPTRVVALRRWDVRGTVMADFQLLEIDACDALSAMYWPGWGWLAVASQLGSARAQLLEESGKLGWGSGGKDLPWESRGNAPVSMALDTEDTVILAQLGYAIGAPAKASPDRVFATRLTGRGAPIWPKQVEVASIPRAPLGAALPRVPLTRARPGVIRAALPPGASRVAAEITSAGAVK